MIEIVCPGCGSGEALNSCEKTTIDYPIKAELSVNPTDAGELIEWDYTGASYEVNDEGAQYDGTMSCRSCGWQGPCSSLQARADCKNCDEPIRGQQVSSRWMWDHHEQGNRTGCRVQPDQTEPAATVAEPELEGSNA